MSEQWLLVYSQPSREFTAFDFLTQFEFKVYFPRIRSETREKGSPFLARYMFALAGTGRRELDFIPGVARFIRHRDHEPIMVPQAVVDRIRAREDQDGFVQLVDEAPRVSGFRYGDRLRVVDSDGFDQCDALFNRMHGTHRAELFIGILGARNFNSRAIVPLSRIRALND